MLEMFYQHGNFIALNIIITTERTNRMSIDDNNNESETQNQTEQPEQPAPQSNETLETAQKTAGNLVATLLELKESNPKVFFGGIGAIVLIFLIMIMSGGSDPKIPVHQAKAIVPGQSYVLKSANAYDPTATIRLVAVPGSMAAYDDTEEADREGACKHMPQGTPVKAIQSQDAYGKKDVFVEVEMTSGECEGKRGWALAIDLQ
ncbi:hypothetical protein [Methylomonas rivi]|uniref:Uncharacterized protein n=1 Tax=Methylomonas rivi TaxID=2952226 RepID=A0ABT1U346_9GAMM|nr:hypothetical protein [Methylomonas sp. WSC-6]MCQ8128263.1 hypothetical protein [Methylomonas sp. WSC-6]